MEAPSRESLEKKKTVEASHFNNSIIMLPKKKKKTWDLFQGPYTSSSPLPPWSVKHFPCESAALTAFSPLWSLTCDWRNQWCQVLRSRVSPPAAFYPDSVISWTPRRGEWTTVIFTLPTQLVNQWWSVMSYSNLRHSAESQGGGSRENHGLSKSSNI